MMYTVSIMTTLIITAIISLICMILACFEVNKGTQRDSKGRFTVFSEEDSTHIDEIPLEAAKEITKYVVGPDR